MRKEYPYLEKRFSNFNEQSLSTTILSQLDRAVVQKKYVKLTLLDWDENPLKEITGEIVNGNIAINGQSPVRSTVSLSATFGSGEYNFNNANADFAINKKIFVEVGVKNDTNFYQEYPILWFPQGVFMIKSFSSSSNRGQVTIQLSLADKMCLLNGFSGGTFPAPIILDTMDTLDEKGNPVSKKVPIYQIIQELVHHFGGEPLGNIVIDGVPKKIKKVVRWMGSQPLYLIPTYKNGKKVSYIPSIVPPTGSEEKIEYYMGSDVGYILDDFVYPGELMLDTGSTILQALDKIKTLLGNYEYYYDCFGIFHFREIRNYQNTTLSTTLVKEMNEKNYLYDSALPTVSYSFQDNNNLISLSKQPKYENIRNDYVIQGFRSGTNSSVKTPLVYHLAIDDKPELKTYQNVLFYEEPSTKIVKAVFPIITTQTPANIDTNSMILHRIYYNIETKQAFYYDSQAFHDLVVEYFAPVYTCKNWRTELYMQGVQAQTNGLESNYYFPELENAYPMEFDLVNQKWIGLDKDPEEATIEDLQNLTYFLDFIDTSSDMGQFSVKNIGRRTYAKTYNEINCLFEPTIPEIVFVKGNDEQGKQNALENNIPYIQVSDDMYNNLALGGYKNSAFVEVKYQLYLQTTYQTTLNISALPVYYLEPNTRVELKDYTTLTFGEYQIQQMNIPLGNGNMSATLVSCPSRTIW